MAIQRYTLSLSIFNSLIELDKPIEALLLGPGAELVVAVKLVFIKFIARTRKNCRRLGAQEL